MRISTRQTYLTSVSNMQNSQSKLADLQNQLSTGKKLNKPSDDPVAAAQAVKLNRELAQTEKYQDNIDVTQRRLELEETILDNINVAVDRMRELTIRAGNDTLGDADRQTIATEIRGLVDYTAGLMNTQDAQGEYLFAGSKGFTLPYPQDAEGNYNYTGDSGQRMIQIAPELFVPSSDSGRFLFEAVSESVSVTPLSADLSYVSSIEVVDEELFDAFSQGKGDLTLQVQLDPTSATEVYQYQLLDSSGTPVPLDEDGNLTASLPGINGGEKVTIHGLELTISPPALSELKVEYQQDGVKELSVADPVAATEFFNQHGNVAISFDGSGNYTLQDANGDPITLDNQTYMEGEDLVVGGFRLAIGTPENGDSVTVGLPLPALSPVEAVDVTSLAAMYDSTLVDPQAQIVGSAAPVAYDFASSPETFDITVDGTSYTLNIDLAIGVGDPLGDAKAALADALDDFDGLGPAGVDLDTLVTIGDDGTGITLTSAMSGVGSEITVSNFGTNIAAAFNVFDGQTDYFATPAEDVITNGGELKVTYDLATDSYFVDEPTLSINRASMADIGLSLSWDAANQPLDGDSITLSLPPFAETDMRVGTEKQNVLDVALELARVLEQPVSNAEVREVLRETIDNSLNKLKVVAERNLEARTAIGARVNSLENTRTANADFKLFTQTALSSIQDVDFAEAISQLKLEEAILQAAQATFVKISELSLFNFIR